MLTLILLLLIVLWVVGYGPVSLASLQIPLFAMAGRTITLLDFLIFGVILWLIGALPSPFREIAGVFFILWLLSTLGIIAIAGASSMLLMAIIVGLVLYTLAY